MATVESKPEVQAAQNGAPAGQIPVDNPATGQVITHVPDMNAAQVEELVKRARRAQPAWEALGFKGRAEILYRARDWLVENKDRMLDTLMEETGKTREDALIADYGFVLDSLGYWAKNAKKLVADERVRPHSPMLLGKKLIVRRHPFGVVGVIGPWNYPLTLSFGDALPALMAGNTVVIKPSEITPLCCLLMAEGMRAAGMPEDVMPIATGRGETGAALVDHVDMIMFTGSTATGKKIMARASETLTPVSLELGGKDPMIVLRDADLERAANAAVSYAFSNAGQTCTSVERVYVEEPVYDEFVSKVVNKTRKLRQGAGKAGTVDVGAVISPPQSKIVEDHVRDAVDKGASVLVGGKMAEGPGRYFEPTVLTNVDHTMKAMTEETFGPTLPIMKVRDEGEALKLSNDSVYGLNSSVWTKDLEKGERIARGLEVGMTCVNDGLINFVAQEAPFGGAKASGIGARHGADGIKKYTQAQTIMITRFAPKRDLNFYPNAPWRSKLMEKLVVLQSRGRKRRKDKK